MWPWVPQKADSSSSNVGIGRSCMERRGVGVEVEEEEAVVVVEVWRSCCCREAN